MVGDPKAREMMSRHELHGIPSPEKIGKPLSYFALRGIFLDCRGPLKIHPESEWGWQVMVLTRSHDVSGGSYSQERVDRPVVVDEGAWIGNRALLYNCHVQHHAIVACGAVVRNMTVEPHTIVEGNPAVPTRRYVEGEWVPIERNRQT